jgi:hypothetical protein
MRIAGKKIKNEKAIASPLKAYKITGSYLSLLYLPLEEV